MTLVARLIRVAEHARKRNGLPPTAELVTLKTTITHALSDEPPRNGQHSNGTRYISTTEFAQRTGVSKRSAHRYAQRHGRKLGGRWQIPIKE